MENTIGYLPLEHESYLNVQYILSGALAYMVIGSILEGYLFFLYNEKFHPFNKILQPNDRMESEDMSEIQILIGTSVDSTESSNSFWNFWRQWNNLKNAIHFTDEKPKLRKKLIPKPRRSTDTSTQLKSPNRNAHFSFGREGNNIKNTVHMTNDKPKPNSKNGFSKLTKCCEISFWTIFVIILLGLIITILIFGMGLNFKRGKTYRVFTQREHISST